MHIQLRRGLWLFLLMTFFLTSVVTAQPVQPIFTSTTLDGQLIGLETVDIKFGLWKPIAAIGIPTDFSKIPAHIRFKAGAIYTKQYELPIIGEELGNFRLAYNNWPASPILGREGQTGIEVGADLGMSQYRAFIGDLWPVNDEDGFTRTGFISTYTTQSFDLPYDIRMIASSNSVNGVLLPESQDSSLPTSFGELVDVLGDDDYVEKFNSTSFSLIFGIEDFSINTRFGLLANPAELDRFEFVTGVRGISQPLRGHQYWNVTVERKFNMYQTAIPLNLPEQFADYPFIPTELPVSLDGRLFFQGAGATFNVDVAGDDDEDTGSIPSPVPQPQQSDEVAPETQTDMLFSWGISTTLSVYEFRVQAQIIFNQEGETKISFTF